MDHTLNEGCHGRMLRFSLGLGRVVSFRPLQKKGLKGASAGAAM